MAHLSPARKSVEQFRGLKLINRGKVRDLYELPGHPDFLFVFATNGVSIFNVVMNFVMDQKGMLLTGLSHFFFKMFEAHGIKTHMFLAGAAMDEYLPESMRNNPVVQSQGMIVHRLQMCFIEFVFRWLLTGTGLRDYKGKGNGNSLYGHTLPTELQDGDMLPYLLDTPTEKSETDDPVDPFDIRRRYPEETFLTQTCFILAHNHGMTRKRKTLLGDGKEECGRDKHGILRLGDEAPNGDSFRGFDYLEWVDSRKKTDGRKPPSPLDKQMIRNRGLELGVNKLKAESLADCEKAWAMEFSPQLIEAGTQTYRHFFWRLTGSNPEDYFARELGVTLPRKERKIEILVGSESDLPQTEKMLEVLKGNGRAQYRISVMSCHRNPEQLEKHARDMVTSGSNIVIAGAGEAAQLPGVLKAVLCNKLGRPDISVLGIAFKGKNWKADMAARLSIENLPGQPVEMDEDGNAYFGLEGAAAAARSAISDEFRPKTFEPKAIQIGLWQE